MKKNVATHKAPKKETMTEKVAAFFLAGLNARPQPRPMPGHTVGSPTSCCGRCFFFRYPRSNQPQFDKGEAVRGMCSAYNDYTDSHKVCLHIERGEPDVL